MCIQFERKVATKSDDIYETQETKVKFQMNKISILNLDIFTI